MGVEATTFIPKEVTELNGQHVPPPNLQTNPLGPISPTENGNGHNPEQNGSRKSKKRRKVVNQVFYEPNIEPFSQNGRDKLVFTSLNLPVFIESDSIHFEFLRKSQEWNVHFFSNNSAPNDGLTTPNARDNRRLTGWLKNRHDRRHKSTKNHESQGAKKTIAEMRRHNKAVDVLAKNWDVVSNVIDYKTMRLYDPVCFREVNFNHGDNGGVPDLVGVSPDSTVYIIEVGELLLDENGEIVHWKDDRVCEYKEDFREHFKNNYNVKLYTVYYETFHGGYNLYIYQRSYFPSEKKLTGKRKNLSLFFAERSNSPPRS